MFNPTQKVGRSGDRITARAGYVIGLRIDPHADVADWYTAWFEGDAGENRVLAQCGRALWWRSLDAAAEQARERLAPAWDVSGELDSVCDVAESLWAISSSERGYESGVLLCLNLLDDVLKTTGQAATLPEGRVLDQLIAA